MVYQPSPENDPPISYFELNRHYELVRRRISPTMDVSALVRDLKEQGQSKEGAESILWNLTENRLPSWRSAVIKWLSSAVGIVLIVLFIGNAPADIHSHPLAMLFAVIYPVIPLRGLYLWMRVRRISASLRDAKEAKERRRRGG